MRTFKYRYIMLAMIVMLTGAFLVSGCGSKGGSANYSTNPPPTTPPPPPPPASTHLHLVTIQYMAFSPSSLTIPVGDTVQWTNDDAVTHTVTSDTGTELGSTLAPGTMYQHVFMTAGSFPYHCAIHTYMHGSVTAQ